MRLLMKMNNNYLLIVEGGVDEQNIFDCIFSKYGFKTIKSKEKMELEDVGQFERFEYSLNKSNIVIIQGPRNRIHDFLKYYDENEMAVEKAFEYPYAFFKGIFLIYDVDHNDCDDVKEMFRRFPDESTGMLLLSSPCLEVVGDYNRGRTEEKYSHLKEYKADINSHYPQGSYEFIKNNFNELMLYFLDLNHKDFNENNVMEHPRLIVDKINEQNERINCVNKEDSYVIYRYFSTVIYVAVAYANGLVKEIDNYQVVRNFFANH